MGKGLQDSRWSGKKRGLAFGAAMLPILAALVLLRKSWQPHYISQQLARLPTGFQTSWSQDLAFSLEDQCKAHMSKHESGMANTVLVTGAAGFVGFHAAQALSRNGWFVVGLDNFNADYPVSLKRARAEILRTGGVQVVKGDLSDAELLSRLLATCEFGHVLHLAAHTDFSDNRSPMSYVTSCEPGTVSLFEAVKAVDPRPRVVYASSSYIYGLHNDNPFSEDDHADSPSSQYAAGIRSCEVVAQAYHKQHALSLTGLRLFSVYGSWGRPDMAHMRFARSILWGEPVRVFTAADGSELSRDFTYIDDAVAGVIAAMEATPPSLKGRAWLRLFDLASSQPATVSDMVLTLEGLLKRRALVKRTPLANVGDASMPRANITAARVAFGYSPHTNLREGLAKFVNWYLQYYGQDGKHAPADDLLYRPNL